MKKISQIENESQGVKDADSAMTLWVMRYSNYELYTTFKSISTTILEGASSVCVADDGERKFMVLLSDEYRCVDSYKVITEQQYNSLVQQ